MANIKKLIQEAYDASNKDGDFVKAAAEALEKEKFTKVLVFNFESPKLKREQLVMVNLFVTDAQLESGCVLNKEGTKIVAFKNCDDKRNLVVDTNARFVLFDTISDENSLMRLKILTRNDCTWIIHKIPIHNEKKKYLCNAHTHGMRIYTHKDFQMVVDMEEGVEYILNELCSRVKNGETFVAGQGVEGIYNNKYPIKLMNVKESDRTVLRVILPDDEGKYPDDEECAAPYCYQADKLD